MNITFTLYVPHNWDENLSQWKHDRGLQKGLVDFGEIIIPDDSEQGYHTIFALDFVIY